MNIKAAIFGALALLALVVGFNSVIVVDSTETVVLTNMGETEPAPLGEGLHTIAPWKGVTRFFTSNNKYSIDMTIPTQDRVNSTATVTVMYRIEATKTPEIKRSYGTVDMFVDRALSLYLDNIIKDEGRKIQDTRGLADSNNITTMQMNTKNRLNERLKGTGIILQEVLIRDIKFDERIQNQIIATQTRIQNEEAEKSALRIEKTQADKFVAKKKGETDSAKLQAEADAYKINQNSIATFEAKKRDADAIAYAADKQAEAYRKLSESITDKVLESLRIEVRKVEVGKGWQGVYPDNMTIVNGSGEGKNQVQMPFLFKDINSK